MTIVLLEHWWLEGLTFSLFFVFFLGGSVFCLVYGRRLARASSEGRSRIDARRARFAGAGGLVMIGALGAMFWSSSTPHTAVVGANAVELRYAWSTVVVPYDAVTRLEYEVDHPGSRGRSRRETHTVRLTAAGRTHRVATARHERWTSVRELFEQLFQRLPPHVVPSDSTAAAEWARRARYAAPGASHFDKRRAWCTLTHVTTVLV